MADKATLLQKLPPVAKESSPGLTSEAGSSAVAEVQPDREVSISGFQAVTYGSFVLTFILAGFAAVVLYRKAIGKIEQRIVRSTKVLAVVLAIMAMHGFIATYLYTNYLRNVSDYAPLSMTVLIWVILGATTGYVSNRLIELKDKLQTSDAIIDGLFYAALFISVTLAVSPSIGPNLALILSLLAIFLCVVPITRFFIACKRIKFNRRGSKRKPGRSVLYTLVSLPTLVPLFALLYVAELLSPDLTLFLVNAASISLLCYVSFAMLTRIKNSLESESAEASVPAEPQTAQKPSTPKPTAPEMDPLVAELLAEQEQEAKAQQEEETPAPKAQQETPDRAPPARPARPNAPESPSEQKPAPAKKQPSRPKIPKKPEQSKKSGNQPEKDATLKVKPPSKPKKRF